MKSEAQKDQTTWSKLKTQLYHILVQHSVLVHWLSLTVKGIMFISNLLASSVDSASKRNPETITPFFSTIIILVAYGIVHINFGHSFLKELLENGQARWLTPIIPALWEAET